jgi:hypothetical protein
MLDRILASITVALIAYFEKRIERGSSAVDSDVDPNRLRLAGDRIRLWVQSNRSGVGAVSDADRAKLQDSGVHDGLE